MTAWKANENIPFDFADFQMDDAIKFQNEYYIKSVCASKVRRSDTFVLLIGNDTYTKDVYVKAEIEAAVEKGCRLIGVNLNGSRFMDSLCPWFFMNLGALFVPYSPHIVAEALKPWRRSPPDSNLTTGNWYFYDWVYTNLGYTIGLTIATWPQRTLYNFLLSKGKL
jgi:hypothetical protein